MSSLALQRVVVRMLFDPPFTHAALGGAKLSELTDEEHDWIRAADARAFRIDPYRRGRALAALIEEFPVVSALAVRAAGGVPRLDAFFSSEIFHAGIQAGASLALLYAEYARTLDADYALSERAAVIELAHGTLDSYEAMHSRLTTGERAIIECVTDQGFAPDLGPLPGGGPPDRLLLFAREQAQGTAKVEKLTPELFAILELCTEGAPKRELLARFAELGANAAEAGDVLDDLVQSGELVRGAGS